MNILKKCYTLKRLNFLLFFTVLVVLYTDMLHAQTRYFEPDLYYKNSINLRKSGMIVLGTWAGMNLFSGLSGNFLFENERKYFFQMNAAWNVVNLGIATLGYVDASNINFDLPPTEILQDLQNFDRILFINAGLDLLYIGTGGYLLNRGLAKNKAQMIGYGRSILLQGGFLFLFDVGLLLLHSPITQDINLHLSNSVKVTPTSLTVYF